MNFPAAYNTLQKHRLSLLLFASLFFGFPLSSLGQNLQVPITVSYYSPYLIQPGVKIGTRLLMAELEGSKKRRILSLNPQIAYFTQIGTSQNYVVNGELSLRSQRKEKKRFQGFGLGLGYLLAIKRLGPVINLGSAEISSGSRENNHFFLPTLSYALGLNPLKGPDYYVKIFLGKKFSFDKEGALFFGFETGITLNSSKQN